MKRLVGCIKGDLKLQVKYGFYAIYTIITILYILLLNNIPLTIKEMAIPYIVFSDPSFLGFFFIGGLILLEKGENTLEYITVTPLRIREYLLSKIISLTLLAVLTSSAIIIFSYGGDFKWMTFLVGVILTSTLFILIGFIAVAKFQTVNKYLLTSMIYMIIFASPLLDYIGLFRSQAFYVIPTHASLIMIGSSFKETATIKLIYGVIYLCLSIGVAYKWAYHSFYKFIILKEGVK